MEEKEIKEKKVKEKKVKKKKVKEKIRRVKTITPYTRIIPYIMETRCTSQNFIFDKIDMKEIDKYIKRKQDEGRKGFSIMHVIIAAYVRMVSQRPAVNRFIRGQKIYTRELIEVALVVKKEMSIDSPDTIVKFLFRPDATAEDVYDQMNAKIDEYKNSTANGVDRLIKILTFIPGLFLRWTVRLLRFLDYFGLLPRKLTNLSPFHASLFITSMGSLGIPPIVHHLYDFGTVPVFIAFGSKQRELKVDQDGNAVKNSYVEVTYNLDERICDGFYYASALKYLRSLYKNVDVLDTPPEKVVKDIK